MIATVWTTATDVASGVLAIAVVWLLRLVSDLRDRVSHLEGLLDARLEQRRRRDA